MIKVSIRLHATASAIAPSAASAAAAAAAAVGAHGFGFKETGKQISGTFETRSINASHRDTACVCVRRQEKERRRRKRACNPSFSLSLSLMILSKQLSTFQLNFLAFLSLASIVVGSLFVLLCIAACALRGNKNSGSHAGSTAAGGGGGSG